MTCCDTKIEAQRNADLRITYQPMAGFDLSTFTARMQVRAEPGAAPALLTVGMSATVNGSSFVILGRAIVLTITKEDLALLPLATPPSDPVYLAYDIILTDATGFENPFLGGRFIVARGVTQ